MTRCHFNTISSNVCALLSVSLLLFVSGCGDKTQSTQGTTTENAAVGNASATYALPVSGKQRLAKAPTKAVFGMIWIDTAKNREYIYDGSEWVPHDSTVESFYKANAPKIALSMTQDEVCLDGDPSCTPTGAHGGPGTNPAGHAAFTCTICHKVGGRLVFDKNGPAYAAGKPAPTFDATAKTCSNIACHGVAASTFSYYFPDGTGEPQLNLVTVYGNSSGVTPSWYSTGGAACGACHGNPPINGTSGTNVWHSGYHGGQGPTGANNQCQLCHPDASGSGGLGITITNSSLHANGFINVQATFKSACFNCH